jgi:hypothetical protein
MKQREILGFSENPNSEDGIGLLEIGNGHFNEWERVRFQIIFVDNASRRKESTNRELVSVSVTDAYSTSIHFWAKGVYSCANFGL